MTPVAGGSGDAPALRVTGLEAGYDGRGVLSAVSFEVAAAERLVVVGASGAGKTTLLRAIAGLTRPQAGRIEIGGRDVRGLPPEGRDAVYLHQTPVLFPHLDVFENLAFPLRVRGTPERDVRERVTRVLRAVRLEGLGGRRPRALSGGQRSRVALARAIVARPAALLLDEPLGALDPALRADVRAAIVETQAEHGAAAVLVTHDLDEAGLLGDRVGVLLDGDLAQVAPPAELFARPASLAVARFLGIPNEVPGRLLEDGTFECALGRLPADGRADRARARGGPSRPAVAVFRAEGARLSSEGAEGRVVRLLHRAHRVAAGVRIGAQDIEVAVDAFAPPEPGATVGVRVDPRHVTVFEAPVEPAATGDRPSRSGPSKAPRPPP